MKAYRVVAYLFSILALLCITIGLYFLAKAGQAGDTKSGFGDQAKAFELEERALLFIVGAAMLIGGIFAAISRRQIILRILLAIIAAAVAFVVLWFIGIEIETANLGNFLD